jgi:hypothetical protein
MHDIHLSLDASLNKFFYDSFITQFREIVSLAELVNSSRAPQTPSPDSLTKTLSNSILQTIAFTSHRRRALHILRTCNRREALWD